MLFLKRCGLFFFLWCYSLCILAQSTTNDSIQIVEWINTAFELHRSEPDTALQITESAIQLAEKEKDTVSLISLWRIKGLVAYSQHDLKKALSNFQESYAFASKINHGKSRLLINLGNTYYQQQAYEVAAEKYQQALEFNTKRDTFLSIDALNNLGSVCISTGKFEDAIDYYQQSLVLQKAIDKLLLPTYINMAQTYHRMNQSEKSIATYESAIDLAQTRKDTNLLVIVYRRMGNVYKKRGAYFQSIQIFQKALALQKITNNQRGIANTLQGMGIVFYEQKNYESSLEYLNQALAIGEAEKDFHRQAQVLDFIGRNYKEQLKYQQALSAFQRAKRIHEQQEFKKSLMFPLFSIGDTYQRLNQVDSAVFYINQANELAQNYNQNNLKAAIQTSLGKIAQSQGNLELALQHFRQAIKAARSEGLKKEEAETSKLLAELLKQQNKSSEALFYLERYLALQDTLFNEETTKKITQVETQYQFEKEKQALIFQNEVEKQRLDKEIQRQRAWQIILGIALILSLLAWFFYSRYQRLNAKVNEQRLRYEQKERERLAELDSFKSRFFTNIAHELRTPLTLILGPVQRLLKNNRTKEGKEPMLELIQDNAQNLLGRVNEILDLSKIETKEIELKETPTLLYAFIQRLMANFEGYAQQKSQTLQLDFRIDPTINVLLDQNKFQHIFNNYLSNALKFTPEKGQVDIVLYNANQNGTMKEMTLEVKDNGSGIPGKDLPYIFDRFYQVEGTDAQYGGTGIGLALSKEMAKLMNGEVGVRSELGKGSTFYCRLPLKEVNREVVGKMEILVENSIETLPHVKETPSATNILVVEDNPQLNNYLRLILSEHYQVIPAKNGQEALEKLATNNCQLILSDIMMPVMDGFELLQQLKSSENYCHLPVIMLTAKGDLQDKLKALRIGVDDYLIKPFVEEELLIRIQNLLQNRQNRQVGEVATSKEKMEEISTTSKSDLLWLEEVEILLKKEMTNRGFHFDLLANQLFISRSQLQRRIKKVTGLTPNKYFREIRLQSARTLLESGKVRTVSEAAYAVGFETPKYFSKIYQERFGRHPKVYL